MGNTLTESGNISSHKVNTESNPEMVISHSGQQWLSSILWDGPPPSRDHFKGSSRNIEEIPLPATQKEVPVHRTAAKDEPQIIDASLTSSSSQRTKTRSSVSLVLKPTQTIPNDQNFDLPQSELPSDALLEIGKNIIRSGDVTEPFRRAEIPIARNAISKQKAQENIEEYFGAVMKRALEQLQVTISRGRQSQLEITGTRTYKSTQMARAKAERLKTRFIQEFLAKAQNRIGNDQLTNQP